ADRVGVSARLLRHAGHLSDPDRLGCGRKPGDRSVLRCARSTYSHRRGAVMTTQSRARRTTILNSVVDVLLGLWSGVRLLARNRVGLLGLIGLVGFVLLAFVGPYIVPLDTKVKVTQIYAPLSWAHPLGTDSQGKDVWSQIVHGGRDLIIISVAAALLSTII